MTMFGHDPAASTRLGRIAQEIAERLAQQHLVAFNRANSPSADIAANGPCFSPNLVRGALADRAQVHAGESELGRPRKVEKIRHDLAERIGFGANALHVGR